MPIPRQRDVEVPLLRVIQSLGGQAEPRTVYPLVAKYFPDLTEEEQNQRMESAPANRRWWNTVQWARQRLVELNQIDGSTRGVWKITNGGLVRIASEGLAQHGMRRPDTNWANERQSVIAQRTEGPSGVETEVNLRDLVNANIEQVRRRLITELTTLSSRGFEKFCSVLLGQLGYEDLEITNRGADGGIDGFGNFRQGVVRIKSAFQAKKWTDAPVGRPEVNEFRGSIQGEYDHGVFLTTSRFTKDAQESSVKKGAITILLLDGNAIADLMIEKGLGVRKQSVYLSEIDDEFFDFDEL